MNARDDLLRAHVYAAFDARGTEGFDQALRDVYDGWMLWPKLAYQEALQALRDSRRDES